MATVLGVVLMALWSGTGDAPSLEGTLVGISLDGYINVKTGGEVKAVVLLKTTEQSGTPSSGAKVRVWLETGSKNRAARVEYKEEEKKERKDRPDRNRNPRKGVNRRVG